MRASIPNPIADQSAWIAAISHPTVYILPSNAVGSPKYATNLDRFEAPPILQVPIDRSPVELPAKQE
ncbi:hypothetical protein SAMN05421809_0482 [Natronorubrum daqingense]|uniref:Uncharacterized protein n=1 Tax=Natronorubrum daqingense TaxID=588898 RepID=A0A1N6YL37_9EURY|nr:hypothetical protein SAMN05421809_0482 [Natronorubrum daqingense]